MAKEETKELSAEEISRILGQGSYFTMRGDLAEALKSKKPAPKIKRKTLSLEAIEEIKKASERYRARESELQAEKEVGVSATPPREEPSFYPKRPFYPEKESKGRKEIEKKEEKEPVPAFRPRAKEHAEGEVSQPVAFPASDKTEEVKKKAAKKKVPAPPKPIEELSQEELKEQIKSINKAIKSKERKKQPLNEELNSLLNEKAGLKNNLAPFIREENSLIAIKENIRRREEAARDIRQRHQLEEKRWELEKKWRALQEQKWILEEKIEKIDAEIEKKKNQIAAISKQQEALKTEREKIKRRIKEIILRAEKKKIEEKIKNLEEQENKIISDIKNNELEKSKIEEGISGLVQTEKKFEDEEEELSRKAASAEKLEEKKQLEKERWKIEEKRQKIEKQRWEREKKKEAADKRIMSLQKNLNSLRKKKEALKERVRKIDAVLFGEAETPTRPETRTKEKIAELPEIKQKTPLYAPHLPPLKPKTIEGAKQALDEKAERVSSKEEEDIEKKLAQIKKLSQLRRAAKIESRGPIRKERIISKLKKIPEISAEEEERRRFLQRVADGKARTKEFSLDEKSAEERKEIVFRPVVKKSSLTEKILIRVLILLLIAGIGLGIFFLLKLPKKQPSAHLPPTEKTEEPKGNMPEKKQTTTENTTTTEKAESQKNKEEGSGAEKEDYKAAAELKNYFEKFSLLDIMEYSKQSDLPILLNKALEDKWSDGKIYQIIFRNQENKAMLSFQSFLKAFNSSLPAEIWEKLEKEKEIMLIDPSPEGLSNNFGFISEIKKTEGENLTDILIQNENTLPESLKKIMLFLAGSKVVFEKTFEEEGAGQYLYRCLKSDQPGFGICWAVIGNRYFILASSGKTAAKIIHLLRK